MKICSKCNKLKNLVQFHKNKTFKDGYSYFCKNCFKDYYLKHKEKIIASASKSQIKNKDKRKKYLKKYGKFWRKNNPHKNNYKSNLYRARKLKATPKWVDLNKIKEIYINCPKGYQVDHIVPLKGKLISGLHVPWNLQYLTPKENFKKGNR